MRILIAILLLGLACPTRAEPFGYELFVVACDISACHRVVETTIDANLRNQGQAHQPGVRLQVETMAVRSDAAEVRVAVDIQPELLPVQVASPGQDSGGHLRVQVGPHTLRPVRFSPIATVSTAGRSFQIWGRLAGIAAAPAHLAQSSVSSLR